MRWPLSISVSRLIFSRLRGLLEVTRLVRTGEDLPALLAAIARTISDSLAFRTVVINLYRPEWDDYVVSTVYGSDDARDALLGQVRQVSDWDPLLDQRFLQRGAYLVPAGEFDWEGHIGSYTPDIPVSDDPNSWHPDDALFAPMRAADGQLLGILSVDEPISGRKPSGDEIDVLVAVSEHAALAVQATQEASRAKANREALAHLLAVSAKLNESTDTSELLHHVCDAISEALGFEKVAVQLLNRELGTYESVAESGFGEGENLGCPLTVQQVDDLLASELVEECLLLAGADAKKILPDRATAATSRSCDGRGPPSWQNHWLFVPLFDRRGGRIGYIWADDPLDRLQPEPERLRILRAFANQAMTALEQAAQFEAIQNSHAHQRALIDASPVAIVDFDFEGRVRSWNAGAAEMFGWSPEEVIGRVSPIVPAEELEHFVANLQRIRDTGEVLTGPRLPPRASRRHAHRHQHVGRPDPQRRRRDRRLHRADDGRHRAQALRARARRERGAQGRDPPRGTRLRRHRRPRRPRRRAQPGDRRDVRLDAQRGDRRATSSSSSSCRSIATSSRACSRPAQARCSAHASRSTRCARTSGRSRARSRSRGSTCRARRSSLSRCATSRSATVARSGMREAEAKYRTLVEQLPIATYINDTGMPVRMRVHEPTDRDDARLPGLRLAAGRPVVLPHARSSRRPRARHRRDEAHARDRRGLPSRVPADRGRRPHRLGA